MSWRNHSQNPSEIRQRRISTLCKIIEKFNVGEEELFRRAKELWPYVRNPTIREYCAEAFVIVTGLCPRQQAVEESKNL